MNPVELSKQAAIIYDDIIRRTSHLTVPFGGFVRDKIAGVPPNDLDLFSAGGNKAHSFKTLLAKAGYQVRKICALDYFKGICGQKFSVTKIVTADDLLGGIHRTKVSVEVDLVWSTDPDSPAALTADSIDADVNSLYMNVDGEVKSFIPSLNVDEIVNNIHNKKAKLFYGCRKIREDKLHSKGYMTFNVNDTTGGVLTIKGGTGNTGETIRDLIKAKLGNKWKDSEMNIKQAQQVQQPEKSRLRRQGEKVAYRQGSKKLSRVAQLGVQAAATKAFDLDKAQSKVVTHMLNHKNGQAIIAYAMGLGLEKVPGDNEIVANLAEDFQVTGLDMAADEGLLLLWQTMQEKVKPFFLGVIAAMKASKEGDYLMAMEELAKLDPEKIRIFCSEQEDEEEDEPIKDVEMAHCI